MNADESIPGHREGSPKWFIMRDWELIDNPAIHVVAQLESQGVNLAGLRILRIFCKHNRHLAELLRWERRLIVRYRMVVLRQGVPLTKTERIAAARLFERYGVTAPRTRTVQKTADDTHAAYLDEMGGPGIEAGNRCCVERIPFVWINDAIKEGRRRKVFAASDPNKRPFSRLDFS